MHTDFPAALSVRVHSIIYSSAASFSSATSPSRSLVFSFVLFDLAEIPQEDLKVLKSSFPADAGTLSVAVGAAAVTVDPTSLSASAPLPSGLIRASHSLFQAVEGQAL